MSLQILKIAQGKLFFLKKIFIYLFKIESI